MKRKEVLKKTGKARKGGDEKKKKHKKEWRKEKQEGRTS